MLDIESQIYTGCFHQYVSLIRWKPGDNREIMSKEELIESFSLNALINQEQNLDPENKMV